MKVLLLHPDCDFDATPRLPAQAVDLAQDLELRTLLRAMAAGDAFLFDVARSALFTALHNDAATVLYRQEILQDCIRNPDVVRALYDLAVEAIEGSKRHYWGHISKHPSGILYGSVELMNVLVAMLRKLRRMADAHAGAFRSRGFTALFVMLRKELGDEYLARVESDLKQLHFRSGLLVTAQLGDGNQGRNYILRQMPRDRRSWLQRILGGQPSGYTFRIDDRDEAGARALSELRDRAINGVANALAQSSEQVLGFFELLRTELASYVGCLNLHDELSAFGAPTAFPVPTAVGSRTLRFHGLYDVCLALQMKRSVVGITCDADGRSAIVVTGANQGGKSTFLRSMGVAQLMMQSGMFVGADAFEGELCVDLFTHYKREEDASMTQGKLDEELARMSEIAERLAPNALVLFNESFAATNEREGSEIARQTVRALLEKRIKVAFVTHLYPFARGLFETSGEEVMFLRAERLPDGTRTFRIIEGEPLETSFGEDVYREIFERDSQGT